MTAGRTSCCKIWQKTVALTVFCAYNGKDGQAYIYGELSLSHFDHWKLEAKKTVGGGQPLITISIANETRQSLTIDAPDEMAQQ